MVAAEPDRLQVVSQVARKEVLMRWRKAGDRSGGGFCDQGPMPNCQVAILGMRVRLNRLELSLGVDPVESDALGRSHRQAGSIKDRAPLLISAEDVFDLNQAGASIDRQAELSCESTGGDFTHRNRGGATLRCHAHVFQIERDAMRFKRSIGGRVK